MEKVKDFCVIEEAEAIRHSIFGPLINPVMCYGAENPFRNKPKWEITAVPGSVIEDISWASAYFNPVFRAAMDTGDFHGFLMPMVLDEPWLRFKADLSEFLPFPIPRFLLLGGEQLFGSRGTWAMAAMPDSVTVLGGDALFMDAYFRHAGGRERVQQQFVEYDLSDEWPAFHSYKHGEQAKIDAFYRLLGWPRPDYPFDTK